MQTSPHLPLLHAGVVTPHQTNLLSADARPMLRAANDDEAIALWVSTKREVTTSAAGPSAGQAKRHEHTARSYEREAQRFVLWLRETRGLTLAQAMIEDALAYKDFMADPQPSNRWCGPRSGRRGTPDWRPFAGPLQAPARRQAITILSNLFRFLQDHRYLDGNPFSGVPMPRGSAPRVDVTRSLSRAQWKTAESELQVLSADHTSAQLAWVVRLLYFSGLRLAEVASANCGDFVWFDLEHSREFDDAADNTNASPGGWLIRIVGKGMKIREIPVPTHLVEAFWQVLSLRGWPPNLDASTNMPLLISSTGRRLSAQALYRQLKRFFTGVAVKLKAEARNRDADIFARASTHWLRHTHGSHAVAAGVPIDVVQQNLGHSSLATTTVYVRSNVARRIAETGRLTRQ